MQTGIQDLLSISRANVLLSDTWLDNDNNYDDESHNAQSKIAKAQKSLFGSLGIHLDSHHIWDEHHLEACPSISGGKDWRFPVIP